MNEEDYKKFENLPPGILVYKDHGLEPLLKERNDIELGPEVQALVDNIFDRQTERLDELIRVNKELLEILRGLRKDFSNWKGFK